MTEDMFRRLALSFPNAIESAHMGHPDFRVANKIFATLRAPRPGWGMVKLTAEQQQLFSIQSPGVFVPVNGAWGARGAAYVRLKGATKDTVQRALSLAWQNTAPKRLLAKVQRRT